MTDKSIHIVFQVLNFLCSDHPTALILTADEKLLLIFLAKHLGPRGIYPSKATLSLELKRSPSAIQRSLKRIAQKNIISIDYIPGKSSNYTITLPENELTPGVHATPSVHATPGVHAQYPRRPRLDTPGVHATQSDKKIRTVNKTERGGAALASPLSPFLPDDPNRLYAQDHRLDMDRELSEFLRIKQRQPRDQTEFYRWLEKAADYKMRKPATVTREEVRCTVPEYGPGHPRWEMLHGTTSTEH